mgnify:CR=1 FL=1
MLAIVWVKTINLFNRLGLKVKYIPTIIFGFPNSMKMMNGIIKSVATVK